VAELFFISPKGAQSYEAARSDSNRTQWGCSRTIITGADGTVISTGQQNIIDIAKECVGDGVATLGSAAISNGWFLSSKDELNELFKTLKYNPNWPTLGFKILADARDWVDGFVGWYNTEYKYSKLNFVTPAERHA
jgi:hypothetical protein